uniref:Uncharacterized protein n=1 Tax=Setaria viridis TaxID=4556 RepID=A0A4U6V5J8_SETVI|nr:hypothetical protein SEVIR_4G278300v2 [Setaria viridis]
MQPFHLPELELNLFALRLLRRQRRTVAVLFLLRPLLLLLIFLHQTPRSRFASTSLPLELEDRSSS